MGDTTGDHFLSPSTVKSGASYAAVTVVVSIFFQHDMERSAIFAATDDAVRVALVEGFDELGCIATGEGDVNVAVRSRDVHRYLQ
jgi:hypothetical protein